MTDKEFRDDCAKCGRDVERFDGMYSMPAGFQLTCACGEVLFEVLGHYDVEVDRYCKRRSDGTVEVTHLSLVK